VRGNNPGPRKRCTGPGEPVLGKELWGVPPHRKKKKKGIVFFKKKKN